MMEANSRLPAEQDLRNNINSCCILLSRLSCNRTLHTVCDVSVLLSKKNEALKLHA
jgi:hypothetical protein